MVKTLIVSLLLLISTKAYSQAQNSCFNNTAAFFKIFRSENTATIDTALKLSAACDELKDADITTKSNGLFEKVAISFSKIVQAGLGQAAGAFDDMDESDLHRAYYSELMKIKKIQNPMTRIQMVYELALKHQGFYDYEENGFNASISGKIVLEFQASNVITAAKKYNSAGVCRHFASLLQWSLMQVARHSDSNAMSLGHFDFSSEYVLGNVPTVGGHAWVRVHLPQFDQNERLDGFLDFDLDTTLYIMFSPLYPRISSLNESQRTNLSNQCELLSKCLYRQVIEESN